MADLYTLVHWDFGPVSTFTTLEDAERELAAVLRDEPEWEAELSIESFELVVREPR